MGPVYGPEAWPGQERARKRDAQHADTRFVFARNEPPAGADASAPPPPPLAFAQYRFVVEEGVPLLYLYELQVVGATRRDNPASRAPLFGLFSSRLTRACLPDGERGRGLGRFLLLFVEMLAKACPAAFGGVMLTLQKANERAAVFYARAKYALDETSPCRADPFAEESEYDFEVYSKLFSDEAREALKRAGAEQRSKSCAEREREAGRVRETGKTIDFDWSGFLTRA